MRRLAFLAPLALAACAPASDFAFQDASVTLPDDVTALPPGPNVDVVTANCTGCHSPSMILTQPRLTRAAWEGEVTKMVKVYKAPVAEADMPVIVDYLVATNEQLTKAPLP
jgi:cytochrome c5